jgi:hypothetical protein
MKSFRSGRPDDLAATVAAAFNLANRQRLDGARGCIQPQAGRFG